MWPFEKRTSQPVEAREVVSETAFVQILNGFGGGGNETGEVVTTDSALKVPAVWAAVNFLAGTLASLPLNVYQKKDSGRVRVKGGLQTILHDAWTPEQSSFRARFKFWTDVFTGGRGVAFIERAPSCVVLNIWPLDPTKTTIEKRAGQETLYKYDGKTYLASEILDIPFSLKPDGITHRGPITTCADAIGLAMAVNKQAARYFSNGGVPPFVVTGNFQSAGSLAKAQEDFRGAIKKATNNREQALVLPNQMDIKPLGGNAEQQQLIETQRWCVEQVARIYSLPPTFLQDLTHGTFSNTEQQDLHVSKHTLRRWLEQFEQELNLKLWGRSRSGTYAEHNQDALLRGDFTSRMTGYATGIQNAIMKPSEVRDRENLPNEPAGDVLLIQGATVPLGTQPNAEQLPMAQGNADD